MAAVIAQELERSLGDLLRRERELLEAAYVRRCDGSERVREALARLAAVGSPAGVVARAAAELGASAEFDLVLVSRIEEGRLRAQTLWLAPEDPQAAGQLLGRLAELAPALRYPLIEHDVAERLKPALVVAGAARGRASPELAEAISWGSYVVAPIALEGRAVALLHAAARAREDPLDEVDRELAALYCAGLSRVFERAVLREQIERQRRVLRAAAGWIGAQQVALERPSPALARPALGGRAAHELLTEREQQVMRLIAEGRSNRQIAVALALGEGTVKYHVRNILRKLRARSRSEAISRFAALAGDEREA